MHTDTSNITTEDRVSEILTQFPDINYRIEAVPLVGEFETLDGNGIKILPTQEVGLFHGTTWELFNTVKKSYRVTQNEERIQLALKVEELFSELTIAHAGAVHGGRKVYINLALKGEITVGGDTIKRYVTLMDSNDSSLGFTVGIGMINLTSANHFYKPSSDDKMKHSGSMNERIEELPQLIGQALQESDAVWSIYEDFAATPADTKTANDLVHHILKVDRENTSTKVLAKMNPKALSNMNNFYKHIEESMDSEPNLWGLFNGVTSWTTHQKQAPTREHGRMEGILFGGKNYEVNLKAFEFCKTKLN